MKKLLDRFEAWSRLPEVRTSTVVVRKSLRLINEISKNIPTKEDGKWGSALKLVGLADTAITTVFDSNDREVDRYKAKHNLHTVAHDGGLMRFLNEVDEVRGTKLEMVTLGESTYKHITMLNGGGSVLIGADQHHVTRLYRTKNFDFALMTALLWESFDNRIHAEISVSGEFEELSSFSLIENPLYGDDRARMDRMVVQYHASQLRKKTRTYMLYGPPGCGKSSFGQMFVERIGTRILRLTAAMIGSRVSNRIVALLKLLSPDAVIIDDIDKSMSTDAYLEILSTIKSLSGGVLILTANAVSNFDRGLLRPGRIDTWLEFEVPSAEIRRVVLDGYLTLLPFPVSDDDRQRIVDATDGMTQDYVREAGELLAYMNIEDVLERLGTMRKVLFPPQEEE